MTDSDLCFDVWTIRKIANSDFGREYWHFDDLVNYLNDCTIETVDENNEEEPSTDSGWRNYYTRKSIFDNSWHQYRNDGSEILLADSFVFCYSNLGNRFSRNDEDYFDYRYRRDRYDRDNEPYDQQLRGKIFCNYDIPMNSTKNRLGYPNNVFSSNRYFSHPFYDRYQDESNHRMY
jgi:hypothetical protein